MKPCVVVSEQIGADGGLVAIGASALTGYRLILRDGLRRLARSHGVHGTEWQWLDQGWSRLFAPLDAPPDVRLAILRPALLAACRDSPGALFLGRGIGELLQGYVPVLRVRVVAPFALRCERIMRQVNLHRPRAEERVRRSDDENAWFYRYFFQVDWSEPGRYDLILDTSVLTPVEAAQELARHLERRAEGEKAAPRRARVEQHGQADKG
jgi:hypothetical protein